MNNMKLFRTTAVSVITLGVLFTAFMGFAHTKAGRPLLALPFMQWMGMHVAKGACPLGYDHNASFEDREKGRQAQAQLRSDQPIANTRKALDFVIGQSTRQEISA